MPQLTVVMESGNTYVSEVMAGRDMFVIETLLANDGYEVVQFPLVGGDNVNINTAKMESFTKA